MDINKAYRTAGVIVATHHSHFHQLEGRLDCKDTHGLEAIIKQRPIPAQPLSDVQPLKEEGIRVRDELVMLILAGRQAELIHYTLNAPAHLDFQKVDLDEPLPPEIKQDRAMTREGVNRALSVVTHYWHEIDCLAAWLARQNRAFIPSGELTREISNIGPDSYGLFP